MSSPRNSRQTTPPMTRSRTSSSGDGYHTPPNRGRRRLLARATRTPTPPMPPRQSRSRVNTVSSGGTTVVNYSPGATRNRPPPEGVLPEEVFARLRTDTNETVDELYDPQFVSDETIEALIQDFMHDHREALVFEEQYRISMDDYRNQCLVNLRAANFRELNADLIALLRSWNENELGYARYQEAMDTRMRVYQLIQSQLAQTHQDDPRAEQLNRAMDIQRMDYELLEIGRRRYAYRRDVIYDLMTICYNRMEELRNPQPVATTPTRGRTSTSRGRGTRR